MIADEITIRMWARQAESIARTVDGYCKGAGVGPATIITDELRQLAAEMRLTAAKQEITADIVGVSES